MMAATHLQQAQFQTEAKYLFNSSIRGAALAAFLVYKEKHNITKHNITNITMKQSNTEHLKRGINCT
jgi:hypothetical protein